MSLVELLLIVLATWRICIAIAVEDGPFGLFTQFRLLGGRWGFHSLITCVGCLSVYVGLALLLLVENVWWGIYLVMVLAISALVIGINELWRW